MLKWKDLLGIQVNMLRAESRSREDRKLCLNDGPSSPLCQHHTFVCFPYKLPSIEELDNYRTPSPKVMTAME